MANEGQHLDELDVGLRFRKPEFADAPAAVTAPAVAQANPPAVAQANYPAVAPAGYSAASLAFERRPRRRRSVGALDWVAFVLAFLAPPIGLITGITALIVGSQMRGWTTGIARAATGIGLALSLVLAGGGVVLAHQASEAAAHAAVVAGSAKWCASLRSDPTRLSSGTYDWPKVSNTIAASIPAMQKYSDYWTGLVGIAPAGIRAETQKIAAAATAIVTSVKTTRVLDDGGNVARMQQIVAASGIPAWVSEYCK